MQVEKREKVGGEADRGSTGSSCVSEEWKTWWLKTSERMDGGKDGQVDGWSS